VEDIVDTGRTLEYLFTLLAGRGAASLKVVALLDKPSRRKHEVEINYRGFEIPDEFIVGYGLDYRQLYRNLPYIGALELASPLD
jgi:hypoxanthine phosphoribosyltransferase